MQQIEKQLKQEFQMTLSKFSHEIRNPIALVCTELQLLSQAYPKVEDFPHWENILDNLEYMKELLNELSNYNNAGLLSPKAIPFGEFLNNILNSAAPTLQYLGISFHREIAEDLPILPIDQVKMRQALLNLLRNAQEAVSAPGGALHVKAVPHQNGVFLTIKDNGCGMTKEQTQTIFTPFVTYKPQGTGLGLPITQQIIHAHNGTIQVQSAIGQGTVFSIFLG